MLFLKASLVLVLMAPTFVLADCPDFTFKCPSGESFTVNTCWSWSAWGCQTCRSITAEMKSRCPKYSCRGSVDNWYGRNDGCSSPILARLMTEAFRAACAIHDLCQVVPSMTHWGCERSFAINLMKTCLFPGLNTPSLPVCLAAAQAIQTATSTFGESTFNRHNSASRCRRV